MLRRDLRRQVPQPLRVAAVGVAEATGAVLRAGRPVQQLGGGGLLGVVQIAQHDQPPALPVPVQNAGSGDPNRHRFGAPPVQGVAGEPGPLVSSVALSRPTGNVSSLDFMFTVTRSQACPPRSSRRMCGAPRPIPVAVSVGASPVCTGRNGAGKSTTCPGVGAGQEPDPDTAGIGMRGQVGVPRAGQLGHQVAQRDRFPDLLHAHSGRRR
jgi:hypothetical protein